MFDQKFIRFEKWILLGLLGPKNAAKICKKSQNVATFLNLITVAKIATLSVVRYELLCFSVLPFPMTNHAFQRV